MKAKYVEIRMTFVVEYDADLCDESEVVSKSVACFYEEDKTGIENFLPKAEGLEVVDYLQIERVDVTKEYTEE